MLSSLIIPKGLNVNTWSQWYITYGRLLPSIPCYKFNLSLNRCRIPWTTVTYCRGYICASWLCKSSEPIAKQVLTSHWTVFCVTKPWDWAGTRSIHTKPSTSSLKRVVLPWIWAQGQQAPLRNRMDRQDNLSDFLPLCFPMPCVRFSIKVTDYRCRKGSGKLICWWFVAT